jgi:hypothetical protein
MGNTLLCEAVTYLGYEFDIKRPGCKGVTFLPYSGNKTINGVLENPLYNDLPMSVEMGGGSTGQDRSCREMGKKGEEVQSL